MKSFLFALALLFFVFPSYGYASSASTTEAALVAPVKKKKKKKEKKKKKVKKKKKAKKEDPIIENDTFVFTFDEETGGKSHPKATPKGKKEEDLKEIVSTPETEPALSNTITPTSDNKALQDLIKDWLGTPHRIGGCSKSGIDCSCFTATIYKEIYGIQLKRSSHEIAAEIVPVKESDLKEGDLVFFKIRKNRVSHVGVYLHDGKFVHASTSSGVIISSLSEPYWKKYFYTGGRHKSLQQNKE